MFLTSLLLTTLSTPLPVVPAQEGRREKVTAQYHALSEARDEAGLAQVWKDNRGLVLQTIDADLEGSLALWEKSPDKPPQDEIAALQARALFGAEVASRALDQPIFIDYAASFVGWDRPQKAAFRAGQSVYGRAVQEMKDKNFETAWEAGRETIERASALGDWWGMAMGYGIAAEAARQMGEFEDSLLAFGMARQINNALGLEYSEFKNLQGMLAVARAAERLPRARVTAQALIKAAKAFKDQKVLKETLTTLVGIEKALGLEEAATETQKELDAIG